MITEDRTKVQTLLGVNMVVEAGAGTGKTTLLIDRLCLALVAQHIPAQRLVALTFTEKAAAEIKTRLIFKLQRLVYCVQNAQEDRTLSLLREHFGIKDEDVLERSQQALSLLDRSAIGTIHSFCADILRAYPLEAGLSPNAQIDTGARALRVFEAAWNSFLDEQLGLNAPRAQDWKEVLSHISLNDLKNFARQLCSGRIENYQYASHADMLAKICLQKAARAQEMADYFSQGVKTPRKAEKMLALSARQLQRAALYLQGKDPGPALPEEIDFSGKAPKGWDEESFEEAASLAAFAQKTAPEKQRLFQLSLSLADPLVRQVRQNLQQEGILSFDDLIIKTRNLLQNDLKVRRQLKEDYDALFIDEFQDTDPAQGEMLLFLAEEKTTHAPRWQDVRLAPGKLFVVGDPKQSIYRFRGADITAYELFTDLILKQGGEKCFLQKNFRSEAEIIDMANAVCGRVMVQSAAFQPAYVPIFTDKTTRTGAVEIAVVDAQDQTPGADDLRRNQAQFIANWIAAHVGKLTLSNGKKLAYGDIALLARASTAQEFYLDALRRSGIKFNVEADKNFYQNQEVNDFLNLLRVVDDPEDKIALTGLLRGPLGAFTDEEIYRFSQRGELNVFAKTQNEDLNNFYRLIRSFIARAGRVPLGQLLDIIQRETFLSPLCALAYEGERTLSNLEKLCALAGGYAQEAPVTLGQFLAEAQRLMEEEPERLKGVVSDEALDAVSVITVHKSKGLEFPVVIFTDISRQEASGPVQRAQHIYSWQYNMHGLRAGNICDVNLAFLEEEQKKHARCEEIRVLYVALTRAKEKLLIVGNLTGSAKTPAASFAAAGLYPPKDARPAQLQREMLHVPVHYIAYRAPEEFIYQSQAASAPQESQTQLARWRAARAARETRYALACARKGVLAPSQTQPEPGPQAGEALALGSLTHKTLELYLSDKERNLARALARAAALLQADEALQQEACLLVENFVSCQAFAPFLQAEPVGYEIPFTFIDQDGQTVSGEMDALVRTPQGLWLADYKTDTLEDEDLQTAAQKYAPQLALYRQAVEKLFPGQPVRCTVFFVRQFAGVDL